MNVSLQLIRFRFLQIYRTLNHIGWGYVLLILPVLFIGLLIFLEKVTQLENPYTLLMGYVGLVLMTHTKRSDLLFLNKIRVPKIILFVLEYSLLCLPFTLILVFLRFYGLALWGHLLVVVLSILIAEFNPTLLIKQSNWSLQFIPNFLFEWKGTMRRYHWGLLLIWVLGLFMAMHELAYFIFVFMFAGIIAATFKPTEGKELKPTNTKELYRKLAQNSIFMLILLSPHFVMYFIYNGVFWYVLVGIIFYFLLFQCYCIFYKYAHYVQYREVRNDFPTAIFIFLCPFLPFSLLLLWRTFHQAKKQLY